jgi:predicted transcriptional regulator
MHLDKIQAWLKLEETTPEEILAALFELTETEAKAYFLLTRRQLTVHELCTKMRKDRTTAQRVLQNLVDKGLAHRIVERSKAKSKNYTYRPILLMDLKYRMNEIIDNWSAFMKERIKNM